MDYNFTADDDDDALAAKARATNCSAHGERIDENAT